jgi:predicted secreted hydrolase
VAGLTLAQLEANLAAANAAYLVALNSQSYSVAGRSKANQEIEKMRIQVEYWERRVALAGGETVRGPIKIKGITPC